MRVVSQTVSLVAHYSSNSFRKLARKEYCSKPERGFRFQVIYTLNIPFFNSFPWIFELKAILKLFTEQIQNSGIFRTRDILRTQSILRNQIYHILWKSSILRFLIHSNSRYIQNLRCIQDTVNLQKAVYTGLTTLCNPAI